jgi:hypothetical protein
MYQSAFRKAALLFYALLIGQLVFGAVVYYLLATTVGREYEDFTELLPSYTPYLVVAGTAFLALFLNQLRRNQGRGLTSQVGSKILHYRTTVLLRSAILEAGNILVLTFILLTFERDFWLAFALGIALFLLARPRRAEFLTIYELTAAEEKMI